MIQGMVELGQNNVLPFVHLALSLLHQRALFGAQDVIGVHQPLWPDEHSFSLPCLAHIHQGIKLSVGSDAGQQFLAFPHLRKVARRRAPFCVERRWRDSRPGGLGGGNSPRRCSLCASVRMLKWSQSPLSVPGISYKRSEEHTSEL